jgi:hypothetical protein
MRKSKKLKRIEAAQRQTRYNKLNKSQKIDLLIARRGDSFKEALRIMNLKEVKTCI